MKNGKEGIVREIMMGSPVTLKPDDTLDLANDVISLGRIRHIPSWTPAGSWVCSASGI